MGGQIQFQPQLVRDEDWTSAATSWEVVDSTGTSRQIDLPADKLSGLKQAVRVLKNVEGIGICELTDQDVVRHVMVQRIIKAYADYEAARNEKRKK